MRVVKQNISKERYNELLKLDRGKLNQEIEKNIPIEWELGYGWYGCYLTKDDENYYLCHNLGSSCD